MKSLRELIGRQTSSDTSAEPIIGHGWREKGARWSQRTVTWPNDDPHLPVNSTSYIYSYRKRETFFAAVFKHRNLIASGPCVKRYKHTDKFLPNNGITFLSAERRVPRVHTSKNERGQFQKAILTVSHPRLCGKSPRVSSQNCFNNLHGAIYLDGNKKSVCFAIILIRECFFP